MHIFVVFLFHNLNTRRNLPEEKTLSTLNVSKTACSMREECSESWPSDLVIVQRQTFLEQDRDFDSECKFWVCHILVLCSMSSLSYMKNRINYHTLSQGSNEMLINEKSA